MEIEIPGVNMEDLRLKGFKVHELPLELNTTDLPVSRGRRDFYKMGMVSGEMSIAFGDRVAEINGTVLFFVNPKVPHAIRRSSRRSGYACLFTESFVKRTEVLLHSPL